ncbi:MAG: peptidoglycan D,D-transpeptidase FtsI family protein [Gammaproteobacteria bacterium]
MMKSFNLNPVKSHLKVRLWLLSALLGLIVLGFLIRIIDLHVWEKGFLKSQGDARTLRVITQAPFRGMVADRNGEPLAISTPVESIWINPQEFELNHPYVENLAQFLELPLAELKAKIQINKNKEFLYLKRHLVPELAKHIKSLNMPGLNSRTEYRRFYPLGEVTAHVLGFTDIDDKGKEGLELGFNEWLSGQPGKKSIIRDRKGRRVEYLETLQEMRPGKNLILSLDQRLQYIAYKELKETVSRFNAEAGTVIILEVKTGEVLAMLNHPSYNPNLKQKKPDARYRNRAVTDVLEPGSVMKTFAVLSALESGVVSPHTEIETSPGYLYLGSNKVQEIENRNYGRLNISGIMQKSSNVGITKLVLMQKPDQLWKTYLGLGFGESTGSGFPGEASGFVQKPHPKALFIQATMSFGYGLNVTPLQLVQAYASLGAGGVKRPISFLKKNGPVSGEQVILPAVAEQMIQILTSVTEQPASNAKVPGYKVAGKTGSARKVSLTGGYKAGEFFALFTGVVPAKDPKFAVLVMIDSPKSGANYANQVAAPLFAKIATQALQLWNVPPDAE